MVPSLLFFRLNGQMWLMIKLSAELFTSTGRELDTTIKFNASGGEEYFDFIGHFTVMEM